MLKFISFGSGSSGNCYYLATATDALLIDSGLGIRLLKKHFKEYGVTLTELKDVYDADCIILAVAHKEFKSLTVADLDKMFIKGANDQKVLVDVKGVLNKNEIDELGYTYWRL